MANKTSSKKRKVSTYTKLQRAHKSNCKNNSPASRERLKKAKAAYKTNAVKNGKTVKEANAVINRVTAKCAA